jgi:hypothetical protein
MWLTVIGVLLLVEAIAGSIVSGGIFTIVLLPLALIALVSAALQSMAVRRAETSAGGAGERSEPGPRPLPSSDHRNVASAPNTPEELAEARRQQQ